MVSKSMDDYQAGIPIDMRLNDTCPFCHSERGPEADGILSYLCGTKGSRHTGLYDAGCTREFRYAGPYQEAPK